MPSEPVNSSCIVFGVRNIVVDDCPVVVGVGLVVGFT